MATFASFFGWRKASKKEIQNTFVLSWEKRYFDISFKDCGLDRATLRDLKERCKQLTGVPIAAMRLSVSGANLKDDTATLSSCGVRPGSIVVMVGEKANNQQVQQTASGNPEEYGLMLRIEKIMNPIISTMDKDITVFEGMADQMVQKTVDDTTIKTAQDKGIYLSEMLMQALITLDGVECPLEFETARQKRKASVRQLQGYLERVDQSRAKVKQALTA